MEFAGNPKSPVLVQNIFDSINRQTMNLDIINQVYKKLCKEGTSAPVFHHGNRSSGDDLQWALVLWYAFGSSWKN